MIRQCERVVTGGGGGGAVLLSYTNFRSMSSRFGRHLGLAGTDDLDLM